MEKNKNAYATYKQGMSIEILSGIIPQQLVENFKIKNNIKTRDRTYGYTEVLYGSLMQACLKDKSLQNAVNLLALHKDKMIEKINKEKQKAEKAYQKANPKKKVGRPRKTFYHVAKSKLNPISLNTASYDEARQRTPIEFYEEVFKYTSAKEFVKQPQEQNWKGHRVLIADGTNFSTVDTPELREHFTPDTEKNTTTILPLPIGRIEGLFDLYRGQLIDYRIDKYKASELELLKDMYDNIQPEAILLGDDLYCSYGHFVYCQARNSELIVQGKKLRNEKEIKELAKNDHIVEWECSGESVWIGSKHQHPNKIEIRKIALQLKNGTEIYLYTTLLDNEKYPAADIAELYLYRWDIELSFREIKSVMGMDITRGKTVKSVIKEIISHLIMYNIMRKMIQEVFLSNGEDIFSLRTTLQESTSAYKVAGGYVDRLGRSYAKKSTGRYPKKNIQV